MINDSKLRLLCFKYFERGMGIEKIQELIDMPEHDFNMKVRSGVIEQAEALLIRSCDGIILKNYYNDWLNMTNRKNEREEIEKDIYNLLEQGYTQKRIMLEKGYPRKTVQAFTKIWVSRGNIEPVEVVKQVKSEVKETTGKKKKKKLSKKQMQLLKEKEEKEALELKRKQEEEERARIEEKIARMKEEERLKKLEEEKRLEEKKSEDIEVAPVVVEKHEENEDVRINKNGIPSGKKVSIHQYTDVAITDEDIEIPRFKLKMPTKGTLKVPELSGIEIEVDVDANLEYSQNAKPKEMDKYRRGDIVFVRNDAYDEKNGIVGKSRPALIIQNNEGNYYSGNVIVCYITSVLKKYTLPTHVYVEDTPCLRKSMVLTEQLQTVKKGYISYMGKIDEKEMLQVEYAIVHSLGLEDFVERLVENECRRRGKTQIDMVAYEMLKNEEEEEDNNIFKTLEVSELASKDFVYDLKDGIRIRRRDTDEDIIDKLSYGLSLKEVNNLIDELSQIKNYLMMK